MYAPTWQDRIC